MVSDGSHIALTSIHAFRVPLRRALVLAGREVRDRTGLLVRLQTADGLTGWGEASPLPGFSVESVDDAERALALILPRLVGLDPSALLDNNLGGAGGEPLPTDGAVVPASARFAIELALLNLVAASQGARAAALLHPDAPVSAPSAALIGGDLDSSVRGALAAVGDGHRAVKLKVARDSVAADIARVRAVRNAIGPSVELRLDANRGWTTGQAVRFADGTSDVGVSFIEEPLADVVALPALMAGGYLPVALDESMRDPDPWPVASLPGVVAVVIKPTLVGGLRASLEIARRAGELGLQSVVSSSFEVGVGLHGLSALACAVAGQGQAVGEVAERGHPVPSSPEAVLVACGLDTATWLASDVVEPPFALIAGCTPPDGEMYSLRIQEGRASA